MRQLVKKAYSMLTPIIAAMHSEIVDISDESAVKAIERLHAWHPDVRSSAIRKTPIALNDEPAYDLDIVVPVYNSEKYFRKCLDSIISQKTCRTFRVICVDDGSQDKCGSIADEYASSDKRVLVLHQENRGHSGARNSALDILDSRYLMFVDSDDFLPSDDVIESLISTAISNGCSLVGGGYSYVREDGSLIRIVHHAPGKADKTEHYGFPWGKIYSSSVFKDIKFPDGYWFEDSIMRQLVFERVGNAWYLDKSVYAYRSNPGQVTRSLCGKVRTIDSLYITMRLYEDRMTLGISEDKEYAEYLVRMARLTHARTRLLDKDIQKDIFIVYANWFRKNFGNRFALKDRLYKALMAGDYGKYSLL